MLPEDPSDIFYGLSDFGSNRIWDATYRYSGMHREDGVMIAAGPGIRRGAAPPGAQIIDLAPTVLHWLDCEVPADFDGRPLVGVLEDDYAAAHPVRLSTRSSEGGAAGPRSYTREEEQEIMDRLRDLGYMN
jgi:hypothetical protein